jgi:hypothetical protein
MTANSNDVGRPESRPRARIAQLVRLLIPGYCWDPGSRIIDYPWTGVAPCVNKIWRLHIATLN